jgi:hypothetical protein
MKNIISIVSLLFLSLAQGAPVIVTCDQNAQILSQLFEKHWQPNTTGPYRFISIAEKNMRDEMLSGALHSITGELPTDQNPHLKFSSVVLQDVPDYGVWQVDCRYVIQNPEMEDEFGYLHMTAAVSDYDYHCSQINDQTVFCQGKRI